MQDLGFGTKMKKGLVLRGNLSFGNGAKYSGALKSYKNQIPHGYGIYFFPEHGQMKKIDGIELAIIKYYSGNFKNEKFHGFSEQSSGYFSTFHGLQIKNVLEKSIKE